MTLDIKFKINRQIRHCIQGQRQTLGHTLLEIMITMSMSVIILALVYAVFTLTFKYWSQADSKSEVQINAIMTVSRMDEDFRAGSFLTVLSFWDTFPKAILYKACIDNNNNYLTNSEGLPSFDNFILYYQLNGQDILRRNIIPASSLPVTPSKADILPYCTDTGQVLSYSFQNMTVVLNSTLKRVELVMNFESISRGKSNTETIQRNFNVQYN